MYVPVNFHVHFCELPSIQASHIRQSSAPETHVEPISVEYGGVTVHEIPPNGQGVVALIALNILSELDVDLKGLGHNTAEYLHLVRRQDQTIFKTF